MALPATQEFSLVGGTAMALRYGHRSSVDLDLFFHENLIILKSSKRCRQHLVIDLFINNSIRFLAFFASLMR